MLVYFSANARDVERYDTYRAIIRAIQQEGGIVVHGWVEVGALRGGMPHVDNEWWDNMPNEAISGVRDADVVIVEATGQSSLGAGYEMAVALSWNKPVLALVDKKFEGGSYIQGVKHLLLSIRRYDLQNIESEVKRFLKPLANSKS